eukprot:131290-Prymnesium_polylepis.1
MVRIPGRRRRGGRRARRAARGPRSARWWDRRRHADDEAAGRGAHRGGCVMSALCSSVRVLASLPPLTLVHVTWVFGLG